MGMDVYGRQPINETGAYFRNNVWWWRPLWNYCETQYPELTQTVTDGHSNSGDGLDAEQALALGKKLQQDIDSGVVAQYEKEYKEYLDSLPMSECKYCNSTGVRYEKMVINEGGTVPCATAPYTCNACNGDGKVKDWACSYPFAVENVQEFAKFLISSGGFNIW